MRLILVMAFTVAFAAPARAAVLPFTASLEITMNAFSVSVIDSGVATVNLSGGGAHLSQIQFAAGAISGTDLVPITDPGALPIAGIQLDVANGAGTIAETSGGVLRGEMALPGVMKLCLFGTPGCSAAVGNVSVPLTPVGQDGAWAFQPGAVNVTVVGAPWTTGTVSVGTLTTMGSAHGPASGTSTTAQAGGSLRLVTPIYITTNIGAGPIIGSFAILTLHFVPEAATAILLGAGIATLGAIGKRSR